MTPSFDLAREPWIPCRMLAGAPRQLGLRAALCSAHDVREVFDPSPLVTVALHRLLLAILHRNFGPKGKEEWGALWRAGSFDARTLDRYFEKWADRFDLLHPERPFCQEATLDLDKAGPSSWLCFQRSNGATLFDHRVETAPPGLSPAEAGRLLIAFQAFDSSGTKTSATGQESANAAPLANCAVLLIVGRSLFETLMLNLHCYDGTNGQPFEFRPEDDKPAWEGTKEVKPSSRRPRGYLDLLTWRSRRMRLHPEEVDGAVVVRSVTVMKGDQFPKGYEARIAETMVAYKLPRPELPRAPVRFDEDRSLWRDSQALLETAEQEDVPKVVSWLAKLVEDGVLPPNLRCDVSASGWRMGGNAAAIAFWRHERLPLPAAYLKEKELRLKLFEAVRDAEYGGKALNTACFVLLKGILYGERNIPPGEIQRLRDLQTAAARPFWAALERHFRNLVDALPNDVTEEDGLPIYGKTAVPAWRDQLVSAARRAFDEATRSLEASPRTVPHVASAARTLQRRLAGFTTPLAPAVDSAESSR